MNSTKTTTILLAGVGGQGTILAADVIAHCAIAEHYDVKISEIHGMSQRGGAVTTVVRFGGEVSSMIADPGRTDIIVSLETTEALRNASYLAQGGTLLSSDETILPTTVLAGQREMPAAPVERITSLGGTVVPAVALAKEAGTAKASNIVMMGALSSVLPFAASTWENVIAQRVPARFVDSNLAAFAAGRAFAGLN